MARPEISTSRLDVTGSISIVFQKVEAERSSTYQGTLVFCFVTRRNTHSRAPRHVTCALGTAVRAPSWNHLSEAPRSARLWTTRGCPHLPTSLRSLGLGGLSVSQQGTTRACKLGAQPRCARCRPVCVQHHPPCPCPSAGCRDTRQMQGAFPCTAQGPEQRLLFSCVPAHHLPPHTSSSTGWEV